VRIVQIALLIINKKLIVNKNQYIKLFQNNILSNLRIELNYTLLYSYLINKKR